MISYEKLGKLLVAKSLTWNQLYEQTELSNATVSKLKANKVVNTTTIDRVCEFLKVQPGDIMERVSEDEEMRRKKEKKELEQQIAELKKKLKEEYY